MLNNFKIGILKVYWKPSLAKYFISAFVLFFTFEAFSNCSSPFLINFKNRTTTSITVEWRDNNPMGTTWEIEIIQRNLQPTGQPTFTNISIKSFNVSGLSTGSAYDVYVRSKCGENSYSNWNGPFQFTTVITNPSPCYMNIPLKDDNCDQGFENFLIAVDEGGTLGQDIFLSSVDIIIEHDWPADLHLALRSPAGITVSLSRFNGTFTDHYGITTDSCDLTTNFSSDACTSIRNGSPPFLGSYRPEESLNNFLDGTSVKGLWSLLICDHAANDKGILRYVRLNFSNLVCLPLENFSVSNITATTAKVSWEPKDYCKFVVLEYGLSGFGLGTGNTSTLNCSNSTFILSGLLPEQEYDIYLITDCVGSRSAPTCSRSFKTKCSTPTIVSDFDEGNNCEPSCVLPCEVGDNIWYNLSGDSIDWIKYNGPTDKVNTGPTIDVTGEGNYLYIEHLPSLCGANPLAILESKCIEISGTTGCDLSFYRHMFGADIGKLGLQIKADLDETWKEIWHFNGESGDKWIKEIIDLSEYNGKLARFRFVHSSEALGDDSETALDQIEFYGSTLIGEGFTYFRDSDGDGYGVDDDAIVICSSVIPTGFANKGGDCDDYNPNINPGMTEILCNGMDDNCNGIEDDVDSQNPLVISSFSTTPASCEGNSDGKISLNIIGGTPPYQVIWSNGLVGQSAGSFPKGFYYATISDSNGCTTLSGAIEVQAENSLTIFVTNTKRATCPGIDDGSITIEHIGGTPPFEYLWSNGHVTKNLENIAAGTYTVTIFDSGGCKVSSSPVNVINAQQITAGIAFKRDVSCYDGNDGIAEIGSSGGIGPYLFTWDNFPLNTPRREFLTAGRYSVNVKDSRGCTTDFEFEIKQPPQLSALVTNITNIKCHGDRTGKIRTLAVGGSHPYSYLWSNNAKTSDLVNVSAGLYSLTVTDNNSCTAVVNDAEIKQPEPLNVRMNNITPTSCRNRLDGSISISTTGGTPEYFYSWKNGSSLDSTLSNIGSGFYGVTAFDQNGCKITINNIFVDFANVSHPLTAIKLRDNACPNERNGEIAVLISQGSLPLDFNWSNGTQRIKNILADTISNLTSGQYRVTITDADGCVSSGTVLKITEYENFSIRIDEIENNLCFADSTGRIGLSVTGGTPPYKYFWSNGDDELNIKNLASGAYQLTVIDANDCPFIPDSIRVLSPPLLTAVIDIVDSSPDTKTGSIKLNPVGGTGPYRVSWREFPDVQSFQLQHLAAGNYSFTITDANECIYADSVEVKVMTSTKELSNIDGNILMYPNPANQYLTVKLPSSFQNGDISLTLRNIQGGSYYTLDKVFTGREMNLDISSLPAGIYQIVLMDSARIFLGRFVKIQ